MTPETLVSGSHRNNLALSRVRLSDLDVAVTLQQAAGARTREILGFKPLPLLADYN